MLKDLEQRQRVHHPDNMAIPPPVIVDKSSSKNFLIIAVSVVITLSSAYMFYLQSENQRLASQSQKNKQATTDVRSPATLDKLAVLTNKPRKSSITETQENTINPPLASLNKSIVKALAMETPTESFIVNKASNTIVDEVIGDNSAAEKFVQFSPPAVALTSPAVALTSPLVVLTAKHSATTKPKVEKAQGSTMEITRKQLTPKTLAKQKMSQAKEAVDNNNISKAEQLFQDVLLILPSEKGARKQLAALWFGRQSYQAALNLLARGIVLDPKDNELRLLKAQIHIKRQQNFAAFKVLQAHPALDTINDVNYHTVLANQAQGSKQYQFAINAYLRLTRLQQHIGRWWLGLAIAYDSNSQFALAKKTYRTALNKHDLSSSARQFVSQRLQELGK